MKTLGIIPARLEAQRLPNKPLLDLVGKPLIVRVWENATTLGLDEVIVATDSGKIATEVENAGGKAVMTSKNHSSGTTRVAEAAETLEADIIINIQGDEPFLQKSQITALQSALKQDKNAGIATLCHLIETHEEIFDPSNVKVVRDEEENALYFSRSAIPHAKGLAEKQWRKKHNYYKHVGIYAFKKKVLSKIAGYKAGKLELIEGLEQLNWLYKGHKIRVLDTAHSTLSVDTQEDLNKARALFAEKGKRQ